MTLLEFFLIISYSSLLSKTGIYRNKTTVMEVRVFLNELLREMELPVFMLEG